MNPTNPQDDLSRTGASSTVTVEELQYHLEGLRSLFLYSLFALIGLTLTLDLFFLRKQMVFAYTQLMDQRPKVSKMVSDYKKGTEPLVRNFTSSLQSFAASRPDFQPILDKYRLILGPYMTPSTSAPVQPAPAKAP
jgi:hypothetical protein